MRVYVCVPVYALVHETPDWLVAAALGEMKIGMYL